MRDDEIPFLTITTLQQAMAAGQISSRVLVDLLHDRAQGLADTNIFIESWYASAHKQADRADATRNGNVGPLHGVPLAHKDIFARPGRQPGCGVAVELQPANLAPAPVLACLESAGAIDLGPLNMAEFSAGITGTNAVFGNVGNPRAPGYCSGASSSGSAAAVAAGLAYASLASDTGASVRVPASFCGVVGLMPTAGTIPTTGSFPLSWSLDTVGILARTTADCALVFETVTAHALQLPDRRQYLTIGIPRSYYTDDLDPAVAQAMSDAARTLEAAGHRLRDVDVVETIELRAINRAIMRAEAAAIHQRLMQTQPELYSLSVRNFITAGEGVLAVDYIDALRLRASLLATALTTTYANVDVLLTPTVPILPPRYDEITDAADAGTWRRIGRFAHFTQPASLFGLPALSVPHATTSAGLPIGIQLVGPPGSEALLLFVGGIVERSC